MRWDSSNQKRRGKHKCHGHRAPHMNPPHENRRDTTGWQQGFCHRQVAAGEVIRGNSARTHVTLAPDRTKKRTAAICCTAILPRHRDRERTAALNWTDFWDALEKNHAFLSAGLALIVIGATLRWFEQVYRFVGRSPDPFAATRDYVARLRAAGDESTARRVEERVQDQRRRMTRYGGAMM